MSKNPKDWFDVIVLLDLYPGWAKITIAICAVIIILVLILAPKKRPPSNVVVEPELDISISGSASGSDLRFKNEGQIDIADVKLIGVVGVHFNMKSKKIGTTHVESPHRVIFPEIKSGSEVKYPIGKMAIELGKKASPNDFEAYCFVIRFRRPSDKRSYIHPPIKVVKVVENEKEMFFPLQAMKGATTASTSSEWPWGTLPEKLDKICRERFGQYF